MLLSALQAGMDGMLVAVSRERQDVSQSRREAVGFLLLCFSADVAGPAEDSGVHLVGVIALVGKFIQWFWTFLVI